MTHEWLGHAPGPGDDPQHYAALARTFLAQGELRVAASAYDVAFGLDPADQAVAAERRALLDQLAVVEHGIVFRYIPAGTFLMGADDGDPDEQPVHPVRLGDFWLADTPVSWEAECRLMGWERPPRGLPENYRELSDTAYRQDRRSWLTRLWLTNKIRLQYCEDETTQAQDWHAHEPEAHWTDASGEPVDASGLFGNVPRAHPERPWGYTEKPVVAVAWEEAVALGERLSTPQIVYRLPTEAEWEKAARGALIGKRYPWGDDPPSPECCDFDRFDDFALRPMHTFPPNGYGLYVMSGTVWEWTADWYDARFYQESPLAEPTGPASGQEHVLRGGSWADCADTLRVSFRMASQDWRTPTIGMRLCRVESARPDDPR